jgi:hypothetical protein
MLDRTGGRVQAQNPIFEETGPDSAVNGGGNPMRVAMSLRPRYPPVLLWMELTEPFIGRNPKPAGGVANRAPNHIGRESIFP